VTGRRKPVGTKDDVDEKLRLCELGQGEEQARKWIF
jgi:hypothetical protein